MSRADYHGMVERAKDYILAGDIFQVVPSPPLRGALRPADPFALYRSLRRPNPSPFLFHLNFGDFQLVGSSPRSWSACATARSPSARSPAPAAAAPTAAEDEALAKELLADPKELAEHLMLLDLGRNDVGRVAEIGTVRVTEKFVVERYSHVMHIVSNVEGDAPDLDPLDVLMAALPAGTLSRRAQGARHGDHRRAGAREARLATPARSATSAPTARWTPASCSAPALVKDGMLYVQAGGGVVDDSDPDAEYEETLNKARALIRAAEEAVRFAGGTR